MEDNFIQWLNSLEQPRNPDSTEVTVGIGDDAAVIQTRSGESLVITTDAISDGTHFKSERHSLQSIGRKAMAVNLSDLAAMAATPRFATISYTLPNDMKLDDVKQLFTGSAALAGEFGMQIIGGDTNVWSGPLTISITAIGAVQENKECESNWLMSGGQPGDAVLVTGKFGGSILGRHLEFTPRCEVAIYLRKHHQIHAATDASDSLMFDLNALARASGCGVTLDPDKVPVSDDAKKLAATSGQSALEHALYDGEDFELILTCEPSVAEQILADSRVETEMTQIGVLVSGTTITDAATGETVAVRGYRHG